MRYMCHLKVDVTTQKLKDSTQRITHLIHFYLQTMGNNFYKSLVYQDLDGTICQLRKTYQVIH